MKKHEVHRINDFKKKKNPKWAKCQFFGLSAQLAIYLCNKLYAGFHKLYRNQLMWGRGDGRQKNPPKKTASHFQKPKPHWSQVCSPFLLITLRFSSTPRSTASTSRWVTVLPSLRWQSWPGCDFFLWCCLPRGCGVSEGAKTQMK